MAALRILLELAGHQSIEAIEPEPHVGRAGGHKDARGRAQAEHALHRLPQAVARRHTVERRNQPPQLGCIEARLDLDAKPLSEHDSKLPAWRYAFRSASSPSALHDPQRSRREQSVRATQVVQRACATHPAYARSTHAPPKTLLRPSPLCANSETRRSASARLRRRIPVPTPFVSMPQLQHSSNANGRMGLLECIPTSRSHCKASDAALCTRRKFDGRKEDQSLH